MIVMAIRKESGEMIFNPPADTAVQAGDYLIVMGRPDNLAHPRNPAGRSSRGAPLTRGVFRFRRIAILAGEQPFDAQ